jgi:hypothetical protein
MPNEVRIEGVSTVHEFVEKASYINPALLNPTPIGVGEVEPVESYAEVNCKPRATHSRDQATE